MTKIKSNPTAQDFMHKHVVTVHAEDRLGEIVRRMLKNKVSNVPVVEEVDGQPSLIGFISEADCLEHLSNEVFHGNPAPPMTAELIMKRHPVCVSPDTNIFTLASIFMSHRLRHLPVVEDHVLLGIVSRRDILQALERYSLEVGKLLEDERHPPDIKKIINHRFIARNH